MTMGSSNFIMQTDNLDRKEKYCQFETHIVSFVSLEEDDLKAQNID